MKNFTAFLFILFLLPLVGYAQSETGPPNRDRVAPPNDPCAFNTGSNMVNAFVPAWFIEGVNVQVNDILTIRDSNGLCVGRIEIPKLRPQPEEAFNVTAWGDNPFTLEKDGMLEGEVMTFEFHDFSAGKNYRILNVYAMGSSKFFARSINVIASSIIDRALAIDDSAFEDPELKNEVPKNFRLGVYPNPFNPTTSLEFEVFVPQRIQVAVYDMLGTRVARIFNGYVKDRMAMVWDPDLPTGSYVIMVRGETFKASRVVTLLK